jgi:hypothetical protein
MSSLMRKLAGWMADSRFLRRGAVLLEKNTAQWSMPMTKREKLEAGVHLILRDYARGLFSPTFDDQQKAYAAEIACRFSLGGITPEFYTSAAMRKPFWNYSLTRQYLSDFSKLLSALDQARVAPPAKLLELGCGSGWMAEFLAMMHFKVTATTLSENDVADVLARAGSIRAKGIECSLRSRVAPMETAASILRDEGPFDAVFVFEPCIICLTGEKRFNPPTTAWLQAVGF